MKKAFTLIELIATIVILGVVTSIVSILIMNVIRNVKDSTRKRSIDNYGRIIETSMAEYQSQYLKYPDSIDQLEIEYVGSVIECETRRINPDKTIYLSECKVNGKKVLDKSTEDGYYHYGTLVLTNEEYVDKLGNNIELALKDYYKENNKYPVNYRLLNLPKLDKDVNCVSEIHPDGTVYLTKCSIDGSYIINENEEDGYYHYGKTMYDYFDNDGNGYIEVEYLESTGTQYIDTLYKPNSNTKIELEYIPTSSYSEFMTIYGTQNNTSSERFYGLVSGTPYYLQINFSNNSSPSVWGFNKNGTLSTNGNGTFSNILQRVKLSVDNRSVKIESPEYSNTYDMTSYSTWGKKVDCNYNLIIFGRSTGGVVSNNFIGKIYYFRIYDNDNLVRDYIPVIDKNNRPCLFDKIEKKCFYNKSTGEFVYSKNEIKYTKVEYLEGTGTQYIDTLYKPNSNTKIELEYIPTSSYSGFMTIYGTQNNTSSERFYGLVSGTPYYLQINFSNNSSPSVWGFNKNGTLSTNGNGTFSNILQRVKLSVDNRSVRIESPEYSNTYDMTSYSTWGKKVDCNYNLIIFGRSTEGVVSNNFIGKIYYFRIYESGNLIHDYTPSLDENDTPCLYDNVENKCYYNQGTGEFLYG